MFSIRKSYRLWDNLEKYGTDGPTTDNNMTRRMRFTCRQHRQEHRRTFVILNTYCFSMATMVTRTRINVMLYAYRLSCCALTPHVPEGTLLVGHANWRASSVGDKLNRAGLWRKQQVSILAQARCGGHPCWNIGTWASRAKERERGRDTEPGEEGVQLCWRKEVLRIKADESVQEWSFLLYWC